MQEEKNIFLLRCECETFLCGYNLLSQQILFDCHLKSTFQLDPILVCRIECTNTFGNYCG